jgi:YihY family inner membrane protein
MHARHERPRRTLLNGLGEKARRRTATSLPVAVVRKYVDDGGGRLASLITFAAFLSFFPLILVVVTTTSFIARRFPSVASSLRTSALAQFPIVGPELTRGDRALPGSGLGLGVGLVGLVWGGLRVTGALQFAFHEVWDVPMKLRSTFVRRITLGLVVLGMLGLGVLASASLGALGSIVKGSVAAGALGIGGALVVSFGLYLAVFWLLSPRSVDVRDLAYGALLAAAGWQALQQLGIRLIANQLRRSSELYGAVGAALGLMWFLSVSSQLLLLALEITVVRRERAVAMPAAGQRPEADAEVHAVP